MATPPNPYDQFEPNPYDQFETEVKTQEKPKSYLGIKGGREAVEKRVGKIPEFLSGAMESFQKLNRETGDPLEKMGYQAGGAVTDITKSPALGTLANLAIQFGPGMLIKPADIPGKVPLSKIGAVKAETLKAADQLGYVVPPSARGGGFLSKRLESIGGKAAVGQEAAIRNQVVTNAIAAKEAGLATGTPITEGSLAAAREQMAAPYKAVAQVSPIAERALERLKIARNDAKGLWNFYMRSADPRVLKEAQALDRTAETLERVIEREATKAGQPQLIDALREARRAIAKNYTVEKALNVGSGDIDARVIGRMLDQGKPLSGDLKTVGKFAQAFGSYAREASGIPTPGVSKSEAILAALLAAGGGGATMYQQGHPYGAALGALPLLATPARGLALSKMMTPAVETVPLSGILRRPIQGSMIPLSQMNPWEVERGD
jgi:hypothetical protein